MKKPEDYLLEIRQELASMNLEKRVVTMKEAKEQSYYKTYVTAFEKAQKDSALEFLKWYRNYGYKFESDEQNYQTFLKQ